MKLPLKSTSQRRSTRVEDGQLSIRSTSSSNGSPVGLKSMPSQAGSSASHGAAPFSASVKPVSPPMPRISEASTRAQSLQPGVRKSLLAAVEKGDFNEVQLILHNIKGPLGSVKHEKLGTLMHLAVTIDTGAARMVTLLARHGAVVDVLFHRETPLIQAATLGRFDVCRALIAAGASTIVRDAAGSSTVLHIVARSGRVQAWQLCQLMLTPDALTATDSAGLTVVDVARRYSKDPFLVAKLEAATQLAKEFPNGVTVDDATGIASPPRSPIRSPTRNAHSPARYPPSPTRERDTSPSLVKPEDVTGLLKLKHEYELKVRRVEQDSFDLKAKTRLEKALHHSEEKATRLQTELSKLVSTERARVEKSETVIAGIKEEAERERQETVELHKQVVEDKDVQLARLQQDRELKLALEQDVAELRERVARNSKAGALLQDLQAEDLADDISRCVLLANARLCMS